MWSNVGDDANARVPLEVGNKGLLQLVPCFIATEDDAKLTLELATHVDDLMRHVGFSMVRILDSFKVRRD